MSHHSKWFHYTSDQDHGFERLKVDVGQTSFFEGREARTFKELSLAASSTYVIQVVVPINVILTEIAVVVALGDLRLSTLVGGTPGGTFNQPLPVFNINNMTPGVDHRNTYTGVGGIYVPVTTLVGGGTHTGGTELDVTRLKAAAANNNAATVPAGEGSVRGIAPGTYYFKLQNLAVSDALSGTFKVRWEERP